VQGAGPAHALRQAPSSSSGPYTAWSPEQLIPLRETATSGTGSSVIAARCFCGAARSWLSKAEPVGGQVVEHVQRTDRLSHHLVQVTERHRGRGRVQPVEQRPQAPVVLVREQGLQPAGHGHGRPGVRLCGAGLGPAGRVSRPRAG
jgi:hypothetical protein